MFNEKVLSVTDYTGSQYRICFHLPKKNEMEKKRRKGKENKKKGEMLERADSLLWCLHALR
jgi:hypothetical protein